MFGKTGSERVSFPLDAERVEGDAAEALSRLLEGRDGKVRDLVRISLENILLRLADDGWQGRPCSVKKSRRLRRTLLIVECEGPRSVGSAPDEEGEGPDEFSEEFASNLGTEWNVAITPTGARAVREIPRKKAGDAVRNMGALVLGLSFGLVLRFAAPELCDFLLVAFVTPLFDTFLGLLGAVVGPLLFFAVLVAVSGLDSIAALKGMGKTVLSRQLLYNFVTVGLAMAVMVAIYGVSFDGTVTGSNETADIVDVVLAIIPKNFVDPFLTGNALQIVFWAFVFGVGLIVARRRVPVLASLAMEADALVQWVMSAVLRFLPAFVFLAMAHLAVTTDGGVLLPLLVSIGCLLFVSAIVGAFSLVTTAIAAKVSPLYLLKTALPAGLIGFTTASSTAAYRANEEIMENRFFIDAALTRFMHPLALTFYTCFSCAVLVLFLFYSAQYEGVQIELYMLLVAYITCFLLGSSIPPIPGGIIPLYAIVLTSMGLGGATVAVFAAVDFVFDAITSGCKSLTIPIHSLRTALKMGKCDVERLRAAAAGAPADAAPAEDAASASAPAD
ncbi:dicarboxylate/amino acid:cation symporter [Arabiibacter massiliensis]|uniref:dicarboxylate/amino acid:cation symporter n=1 Tax=Arabiibacter massiliensis TaxID=1870985 RepID=UPI0009BBA63B|nr:cation:dicarboxylase symporter family transporter [Arabiibacter massiliensis]